MTPLLRRLDYSVRPRLRRETCKRCWRESPVGFAVPDEVWRAAVPARHRSHVLCLLCFDRYATERGVDWLAGGCEFFPVPGIRSSCCPAPWPGTRCTTHPKSASCTTCRSRTSDRSSSSDTSAIRRSRAFCAMVRLSAWQFSFPRRWGDTERLGNEQIPRVDGAPDGIEGRRVHPPGGPRFVTYAARLQSGVIASVADDASRMRASAWASLAKIVRSA